MGFNFNLSFGEKPLSVERNVIGEWFYEVFNSSFNSRAIKTHEQRLNAVLDNPAVMLNYKMIADLGSLGRIHSFKDNVIDITDVLYSKKKKPNFFQSWEQFIKDYYYRVNMGTAYLYDNTTAGILSDSDNLYWLDPHRLQLKSNQKKALQGLVLTRKSYDNIMNETVKYQDKDGTTKDIKLRHIKPFFNVSNGLSDNWFEGVSVLDTLYKVISLSDEALNSWGVNLKYSSKFGVSGKSDKNNVNEFGSLGKIDSEDVEHKIRSKKEVTVSKAPIEINRFVSDIEALKLDKTFMTQYYIIGKMLGIPKDMSEAFLENGATFENQDKAMLKFISLSLQPLGDLLVAHMADAWGFEDLRITWSHLPIYQTAKTEQEESRKLALENLQLAVNLGLKEAERDRILTDIMQ